MKYEIGQKVETPLGVGEVKGVRHYTNPIYQIKFMESNFKVLDFEEAELKPYKTAHDKLVEMGFEITSDDLFTYIAYEGKTHFLIDSNTKTIMVMYADIKFELQRILTQYLEENE